MSEIFTPQNGEEPRNERLGLVLDTNTVLALWMFRDPALDMLREWIEAGNCRLYSREDALEELRRVLAYRQFRLDEPTQSRILNAYCDRTEHAVNQDPRSSAFLPRCRDQDDQKFLEITQANAAEHLLTRDKALLALRRRSDIRIHCRIERPDDFQRAISKIPAQQK